MKLESKSKKSGWSLRLGRGRSYVNHPEEYESFEGRLILKEPAASVLRDAFQLFGNGYTIAEIGRMLDRKYQTDTNRDALHKKLRNPFYAGFVRYGDDIFPHHEPRLVDMETYERCSLKLDENKENNYKNFYSFNKLMYCDYDDCMRIMTGSAHRNRHHGRFGGSEFRIYYTCNASRDSDKKFHPANSISEVEVIRELSKVVNMMAANIAACNPEQPITIEDYTHRLVHKFKEILHSDNVKLINDITALMFKQLSVIDKRLTYSLHEPFKTIYLGKPIEAYSYPMDVIKYILGKNIQDVGVLTGVLGDDILMACAESKLLEEIAEYIKRPEQEIDAVMFDLQLAGKIEQDAFGRYKTI